jgi:dephospho-CoA kinase
LQGDPDVHRALVERFGAQIVGEDGADREAIARIVFDDAVELGWLEQLLHPRVAAAQLAWRDELARSPDPPRVTVAEVPLLYEAGADRRFDVVVVITAPPEVRTARRQVDDRREQRLLPESEKVRRADYVYENDGTLEELEAFVAGVMRELEG